MIFFHYKQVDKDIGKVKVKFNLEQTTKERSESRGIALRFL